MFYQMAQAGVEYAIMEVSSQSLKLNRVAGCDFDMAVFTNLYEDHISSKEHPDLEDYFESKKKLFTMCRTAFVNFDDFKGIDRNRGNLENEDLLRLVFMTVSDTKEDG
jgi:UDP-N-acetylmuramoyl-L-alanyl-D-glutamate--2,6-diaminopimelate ligase